MESLQRQLTGIDKQAFKKLLERSQTHCNMMEDLVLSLILEIQDIEGGK